MAQEPEPKFPPLNETERLPRELLTLPWYARLQGQPVYMGFAWALALALVAAGAWWLSDSVVVVAIAVVALAATFLWFTRK
jgi:hypothetical protein